MSYNEFPTSRIDSIDRILYPFREMVIVKGIAMKFMFTGVMLRASTTTFAEDNNCRYNLYLMELMILKVTPVTAHKTSFHPGLPQT
jgi:hypothetical protein